MFHKFRPFFSVIVLFAILALSGCVGDVTDSDSASVETNDVEVFSEDSVDGNDAEPSGEGSLPEDTFTYDSTLGYYGGILLEGYLLVDTKACAFQDISECKVDVAWFHFDRPDNEFFRQLLEDGEGNSFLASGAISLGCYDADINGISYRNDADAENAVGSEPFYGEIVGMDFEALIATRDQTRSVSLWVEKPILTGGKGEGPDCYSHFRNFDVIE